MGRADGFAGNLPGADGIITDENALAVALENNVAALGPILPDGMRQVTVHVHVVIFHRAHPKKVVEGQVIEARNADGIGSRLFGFRAREWLGLGVHVFEYTDVSL